MTDVILWFLRHTPKWRGTDLTYTTRKENGDHWRTFTWTDRETGKRNHISTNNIFTSLRLLRTISWKYFNQIFAESVPETDRQHIADVMPPGARLKFAGDDHWYTPSGQPRDE